MQPCLWTARVWKEKKQLELHLPIKKRHVLMAVELSTSQHHVHACVLVTCCKWCTWTPVLLKWKCHHLVSLELFSCIISFSAWCCIQVNRKNLVVSCFSKVATLFSWCVVDCAMCLLCYEVYQPKLTSRVCPILLCNTVTISLSDTRASSKVKYFRLLFANYATLNLSLQVNLYPRSMNFCLRITVLTFPQDSLLGEMCCGFFTVTWTSVWLFHLGNMEKSTGGKVIFLNHGIHAEPQSIKELNKPIVYF